MRNNEMVVDYAAFSSELPWSIDAFFYVVGSTDEEKKAVHRIRDDFVAKYPEMSEAAAPPVLVLDMANGLINVDNMAPFALPKR